MTTWFTAELHLGHRNIIRYCDRRFESVGVMNRALIARWNEIVDDDDTHLPTSVTPAA
jgi:calcineurin-like phosphoesterase family protein